MCSLSPPTDNQTFKLDGSVMIDPLSLADFPSIASARSARIQVEVAGARAGSGAGAGAAEEESKKAPEDSHHGGKEADA